MQEIPYNHQRGNIPASISMIPLFAQLKEATLEELLGHASIVQLDAGETFLKEGGRATGLFIILKGKFEVSKNGRAVATLTKAGELLGEMSFILNQPHQANVTAKSQATVFKIDSHVMDALPNDHYDHFQGTMYRYLTKLLAERLVKTSEQLTRSQSEDIYYL